MSSEYISRRQFLKRVIIGGGLVVSGAADLVNTGAKLDRLTNEAKNEAIEQGITPPDKVKEVQQPEEAKAQQTIFDKAVHESFVKKTNVTLSAARLGADLTAILGGSVLGFDAMYKKSPSWGPWMEHKK
jgi:hypothetical protein